MSTTTDAARLRRANAFALSLILMLQGLAVCSSASAQAKRGGERGRSGERRKSSNGLKPRAQEVTALPPVNMQLLGSAAASAPEGQPGGIESTAEVPREFDERVGAGVPIPEGTG